MKTPTDKVIVTPHDAAGNMIKDATRSWEPGKSTRTFAEHVAYCIGRAPGKTVTVEVYTAGGEVYDKLDAAEITSIKSATVKKIKAPAAKKPKAEPKAKVAKPKRAKKVKEPAKKKVKGDGRTGATFANAKKLPNRVGVFATAQDTLGKSNPLSDKGWTAKEVAGALHKIFPQRSLDGLLTTVRCQISRNFGSNVKIHRVRDGRECRYSIG